MEVTKCKYYIYFLRKVYSKFDNIHGLTGNSKISCLFSFGGFAMADMFQIFIRELSIECLKNQFLSVKTRKSDKK